MQVLMPLGPWRGFWTIFGEFKHHPMRFEVTRAIGQLEGAGEDEVGRFKLVGQKHRDSELFEWVKSYIGQHDIKYRGTWVDGTTGFVGRWFSEDRCGGTFALWAGEQSNPPSEILKALPRGQLRFECLCGKGLDIEPEDIGTQIECPWCSQVVVAPDEWGKASVPKPVAEGNQSPTLLRCPGCASPCSENQCRVCNTITVSNEHYSLLTPSHAQTVIAADSADWIFRKFGWLIGQSGYQELSRYPLILPTEDWFPRTWTPTQRSLEALLSRLQQYAGLEHVRLTITTRPDDSTQEVVPEEIVRERGAAGCFYAPVGKRGNYRIEVREGLFEDRLGLVATLSHELGHLYAYERLKMRDLRPLDHEFLTDLLTIALGFGFFTCEASFRYRSWARARVEGWSISTLGYLAQADLSFAFALWCVVFEKETGPVVSHLGVNSRSYFKQAQEFFDGNPEVVEKLRTGRL